MTNVFTASLCLVSLFALIGCASTATKKSLTSTAFSQTNTAANDIVSTIKILGTLPPGLTLETLPGEYVTEYYTVVVQDAWDEFIPVPSEYQWVEGEIEGEERSIIHPPPTYETVTEPLLVQKANTELRTRPALYVEDGTVVETAEVIEQVIPATTKTIKRRVRRLSGANRVRVTPYEIKDGRTRIPIRTFQDLRKTHPAITEQIESRKQIGTPAYIIKDEEGQIIHSFTTYNELKAYLK